MAIGLFSLILKETQGATLDFSVDANAEQKELLTPTQCVAVLVLVVDVLGVPVTPLMDILNLAIHLLNTLVG